MDVKAAATRKLGPLPAWGWGVVIGGGFLAIKFLRGGGIGGGGGGGGAEPNTILVPTGAPSIPSDYISQLGQALDTLRQQVSKIAEKVDDQAAKTPTIPDADTSKPKPGTPTTPPSAKPTTNKPVSAKPGHITLAQAKKILREMGFRESLATSGAWIRQGLTDPNAPSAYVWKSEDSFRAWVNRVTRDNPDKYRA